MSNNHYLKAEDLLREYNNSKAEGKCNDKLLGYFRRIAKHFATRYNNISQLDQDACVEYAIAEAWLKWDSYNPEKSKNIFSFYTTVIANAMMTHYKTITRGSSVNISIEALFTNHKEQ